MLIKLRIINSFLVPFFQVAFGFFYASFEMLMFGYILGSFLAVIFSLLNTELKFLKLFKLQQLKDFLNSYRDIPALKLPADFINNLAQQAPTFLVSFRFGEEYAGFLALTLKFMGAPLAIIGRAISDVFRPLIIKSIENKGNCMKELLEASIYLSITSILILIIIFPFGENIFLLLFGEEWVISGTYASILSIFFAFRMMASPVSYILTAFRKVGVELIVQLILLILVVLSFILSKDVKQSIIFFTIFGSIGYLIYYFVSFIYSFGTMLSRKNE
jgi:O-antigen/teichoic acid export membrane protein